MLGRTDVQKRREELLHGNVFSSIWGNENFGIFIYEMKLSHDYAFTIDLTIS